MPQQYLTDAAIEQASCLRSERAAYTHRKHRISKSETGMRKLALVGAYALTMVRSFSPLGLGISPASAQEITVTEGQIAGLHAALHLTTAQEQHWRAVAGTLRSLGRAR